MIISRNVRRGAVVLVVGAAVLGSGVAYAAWSSSGTGNASAKAGTALAPTVNAVALASGNLFPGASGEARVQVVNPNPYPVRVVSVAPAGTVPASGSCPAATVSFTGQAPNTAIAAGGSTTLVMAGAVQMIGNADNACQGAAFEIPVTVTIASGS